MQRRELLAGGGLVAAATLAGCLGSAQEDDERTNPSDSRTVTVRASGEAAADPDLARLSLGVESTGEDAAAVRDDLATRAEELEAGLLEYGLDDEEITTDRFRIRERYDHEAMREDGVEPRTEEEAAEYRYYVGTHTYAVEVHDVDDVGGVIDAAIDAGADEVGRIVFTLSDDRRDELREEALEEALEDARTEADFVAAEIGASVVDAQHVDSSGANVSPVRERYEMADATDDADVALGTNIRPDDVTVGASVTVKYEIA